jgi:hypothetical protein
MLLSLYFLNTWVVGGEASGVLVLQRRLADQRVRASNHCSCSSALPQMRNTSCEDRVFGQILRTPPGSWHAPWPGGWAGWITLVTGPWKGVYLCTVCSQLRPSASSPAGKHGTLRARAMAPPRGPSTRHHKSTSHPCRKPWHHRTPTGVSALYYGTTVS